MKTVFGLLLAALIVAAYVMGTGAYNMAAIEKHWPVTEKLIEWMRINSITARAKDLEVPAAHTDNADSLSVGATHYDAMCTGCHLSPGQSPTELAQGLYPQAPVFHEREPLNNADDLREQAKAYFWVIKNGIKMTAMPAWGLTHDDETIWSMALFAQKLGGMSATQYAALTHANSGHGHQHTQHEHNRAHHDAHSEAPIKHENGEEGEDGHSHNH